MKEKQSGDVFAMKTLKKSQTLAQESVSKQVVRVLGPVSQTSRKLFGPEKPF